MWEDSPALLDTPCDPIPDAWLQPWPTDQGWHRVLRQLLMERSLSPWEDQSCCQNIAGRPVWGLESESKGQSWERCDSGRKYEGCFLVLRKQSSGRQPVRLRSISRPLIATLARARARCARALGALERAKNALASLALRSRTRLRVALGWALIRTKNSRPDSLPHYTSS